MLHIQDYNGLPFSLLVLHIQDYNGLHFTLLYLCYRYRITLVFPLLYLCCIYRITMVFHLVFTFNSKSPFPRCHHNVLSLVLYPQGSMVNLPEEENTPEKRVNKIFDIMDKVSQRKTYLHV